MIRDSSLDDLPAILEIYNAEIRNSTSVWTDNPVDLANRRAWYELRRSLNYPVLVAELAGNVVGFGSFGDFRAYDGYRLCVEHSVYVAEPARGKGLGRRLIEGLYEPARVLGKRIMIGCISADNPASLRLHANLGFVETGRLPEIGTKFGARLDLVLMQKKL